MRRRDFLKAGAVGASASILDACASPEEEFIVQRVRQTSALPGESVWLPGVCRQCAAACGIQIRVVDGDARKIEGLEAHPVNRGGVCALGHSVLQELYNPDRILTAQRRVGGRGSTQLEAISWEDAVASLIDAISSTPSDRIALVSGGRGGFQSALWRRFASAIGAPPPTFVEAPELEVERAAAQIALGTTDVPHYDLAGTEYALSVGAPLLDRWRSPVHYTRAVADMRRGRATRRGKLVQAEARMSLTAANADEWLPIRPGTEGLLARAIAGHILATGLADAAAAQRYRTLFPGAAPSVEEAAAACDVPAERIARIAEELASVDAAVVVAGGSAAAHTNGLFNVVAALGLNVLLDNLGRPGGVYAPTSFGLSESISAGTADGATLGQLAARLRGASTPVDLLIVADVDLVHLSPAGLGVAAGLANVGTVIALTSFLDDTAVQADVILPVATELERFEAAEPGTSVGVSTLSLAVAAVEPMGDGRHPADVVLEVAAGLGDPVSSRFPWSSFEAMVRARIGEELGSLPGGGGATASAYLNAALERGGIFGDGASMDAPPGPRAPAPEMIDPTFEGAPNEFEFLLLPFESLKVGDGRGANRPWLQEHSDPMSTVMWNGWVELSPADAERLGIHDGDRLAVASEVGSVEAHAVLDPAVRPGVIAMPMGHGHVAYGRYAEGRGANVMALVGPGQVVGTSAAAWASTRVSVRRLGEGELARFGRRYEDRGAHEVIPAGWAPHVTSREVSV